MGMMSRKETAEAVVQKVRDLAGLTTPDQPIPSAHRYVAMMCILNLGARSFSHFLNAIERYQQLIFALGRDKSEKRDLLMAVHDFWRYNGQMKVIVIDKYLQYGVVEASDVVSLLFGELSKPAINEESGHPVPTVWTNYYAWEVLRMVIDKSQGRIASIERRVADLEAMELQARTRRDALRAAEVDAAGAAGDSAEVPSAVSEPGESRSVCHTGWIASDALAIAVEDSSQLQDLKSRREQLQKEYSTLLYQVTASFVQSLVPETYKGPFVTESVAHLQNIGELPTLDMVKESAVWDVLARLGWYREFVRLVSRFVEYDIFFLADISPHAARKANREFRSGNDRS
jgi:nuclear cap-binding protein subunit 1